MPIGALSRLTGVKITTIRYYEREGLMPEPARTEGERRSYGSADARRLAFIRHARQLGFETADVRALLDLADQPQMACAEADQIARRHLDEVNDKISQLNNLKSELERMVETCGHGQVSQCRVIDVLADHGLCAHDSH
ncbi:helix-turn-helix domain-containing protein [soil metagenome]